MSVSDSFQEGKTNLDTEKWRKLIFVMVMFTIENQRETGTRAKSVDRKADTASVV